MQDATFREGVKNLEISISDGVRLLRVEIKNSSDLHALAAIYAGYLVNLPADQAPTRQKTAELKAMAWNDLQDLKKMRGI